ncbi:MAG: phenylalanine--tRNA ligase subunit alpha [Candidatus Peribacteraceae bacterium]|nr:phenylalanine--tRNA ligase subunit alpha [Candidatus Peribacteraceae bacterium]
MSLPAPYDSYLGKISSAADAAALEALRLELFGRKAGLLTMAMKDLGAMSPEERKARGQEMNRIKTDIDSAFSARETELAAASFSSLASADALDVTLDLPSENRGHLHPVHEFIRKTEEVFGRMGFDTARGPELETEHYNFNMLNIPETHPARDAQDTFWVSSLDRTVLRTHTSPVQIRYMEAHKPPFRMICTGKVYRKDSDATHSPMFHQIEGLMIGKTVSMANMKAVMEQAVRELISTDAEFRWRTGYFPFVEPGLEMDMRWRGDESQSREGRWLEIVGCGMVHPNVLRNVGIDPDEYQGFAFGFGVERMIMIRHQIPDLRLFFSGDLRFLRQF